MQPQATWTVHTSVFDGPMDLLLYLVQRDGIDLKRLQIAPIADSYVAYLDRMRHLNLSLAGDYLVMAATLVHLKSLELIPRLPTLLAEQEEDPREELARRLEEYARYREVADQLDARHLVGREVFVREPEDIDDSPAVADADAFSLLDALFDLLARQEEPEPVVELSAVGPSFEQCCASVLEALGGQGGRGELAAMLRSIPLMATRVLTFVGVLEMARLGWVSVDQQEHLGPVELEQLVPTSSVDLHLISGWVEDEDRPA